MEQGSGGGEGVGGSAVGGGLTVMQSHEDYVLQLLADGERDRAWMQVAACWDDFSVFVRRILDRWDDDIEDAVDEAEQSFEPDWGDCPNCPDHETELETLHEELDEVVEERDELKVSLEEVRDELAAADRSVLALLMVAMRLPLAAAQPVGE